MKKKIYIKPTAEEVLVKGDCVLYDTSVPTDEFDPNKPNGSKSNPFFTDEEAEEEGTLPTFSAWED